MRHECHFDDFIFQSGAALNSSWVTVALVDNTWKRHQACQPWNWQHYRSRARSSGNLISWLHMLLLPRNCLLLFGVVSVCISFPVDNHQPALPLGRIKVPSTVLEPLSRVDELWGMEVPSVPMSEHPPSSTHRPLTQHNNASADTPTLFLTMFDSPHNVPLV